MSEQTKCPLCFTFGCCCIPAKPQPQPALYLCRYCETTYAADKAHVCAAVLRTWECGKCGATWAVAKLVCEGCGGTQGNQRRNAIYPAPGPELKDTNPKDAAATSRLDLSLVPESAIAHCALAMTEGHLKYGGYNWRTAGVLASVYYAGMGRHRQRWWNGQDYDPKTLVTELGYIMANAAILIDAIEHGKLVDDRPPKQDANGLLTRLEAGVKHLQAMFKNGPKRHTEQDQ